jgi:hypothetical protein
MAQRKQVQRVSDNPSRDLSLERLRDQLREFATARDWNQFHSPKNLATALCVEAGELLEHFQWLSDEESLTLPDDKLKAPGLSGLCQNNCRPRWQEPFPAGSGRTDLKESVNSA